ncbi:MAG: hypothetical protein PHH79_06465 [Aminobacterium colombiense]|nr:hypothetical protein [Aminobacterium colombiense]
MPLYRCAIKKALGFCSNSNKTQSLLYSLCGPGASGQIRTADLRITSAITSRGTLPFASHLKNPHVK